MTSQITYNFDIDVCNNSKPVQVLYVIFYKLYGRFFLFVKSRVRHSSQHVAAYLFLGLLGHCISGYNNPRATLNIILRCLLLRYFLNHSINRIGSIAFLHISLIPWRPLSSLSTFTPRLQTRSDGCTPALPIEKSLRTGFLTNEN